MRCQLLRNFLAENSESLLEFPTISRWAHLFYIQLLHTEVCIEILHINFAEQVQSSLDTVRKEYPGAKVITSTFDAFIADVHFCSGQY